ncbi:MAG: hypothetical protein GF364_16925, partial [Candidatus Lokiarchaeota archaeon]|nr:hypothetical protein [Candidatus Lokiarchaeota archaeon]
MIQSVFIILPEKQNACIFYGQIDENDEIEDLSNILGVVVEYASRLDEGDIKPLGISQGKFAYGKFQNIYVIFKIQPSDDLDEIKSILKNLATGFINLYGESLKSADEDPSKYEDFSNKINAFLSESEDEEEKTEEKVKKDSGEPKLKVPEKKVKAQAKKQRKV